MGILSQTFGDKLNNFQTASSSSSPIQVTTTSGKQYSLDGNQVNWIKSRYKQDGADTYGWDDADQYAKQTGQLSAKMRSTYKNSNVDRQLAEMGLPSEKNLEKYIADYQNWHTGGISDYFGKDVPQDFYTKTKDMFKGDWQYDDTQEDQLRKSSGQMPSKLASKYTDTEIDDELRAAGLPPVAEMGKYIGRYNNYSAIDNFYKNASVAWANLGMTQDKNGQYIQNDNKVYTMEDGRQRKGKDLYADAFYDELRRRDKKGDYVYGNIFGMFKNNHLEDYDPDDYDGTNYNQYLGKEFANAAKVADLADDYAAYTAFSYDDFAGKYGDYYDKYLKNYKFSDGQTLEEKMKGIAIKNDEQARSEFYDVSNKWFDGDKGIYAFVERYKQAYPSNTYEQMFTDMFENGVSEHTIWKTMWDLRRDTNITGGKNRAEDKNSGHLDITDAFNNAKKNYKKKQEEKLLAVPEAVPEDASTLTAFDAMQSIEQYMKQNGGWTADNATKAVEALHNAGASYDTIKGAVEEMRDLYGVEHNDVLTALVNASALTYNPNKAELEKIGNEFNAIVNGNVDYNKRPIVLPEAMWQAGYTDFDKDDIATTYFTTLGVGEGDNLYTVLATPILNDGTVLSKQELEDYVSSLDTSNGIKGLLDSDKYGIVVNTRQGDYDPEYWEPLIDKLGEIKEQHADLALPLEFSDRTLPQFQKDMRASMEEKMKMDGEDEATIETAYEAIDKMLANLITTDEGVASVNDVIAVLDSIESANWNNPVAMEKALERYGFKASDRFTGFTGLAKTLTKNWSKEDKLKLAHSIGSTRTIDLGPEFDDFTKKLIEYFGDADATVDGETPRPKHALPGQPTTRDLRYYEFEYALDWAKEQIANGTLTDAQAYQVLSAEGFSPELEQYVGKDWHEAIYKELMVPQLVQQAGGAQLATWEEMTPEEQQAMATKMFNNLTDEQYAQLFGDADWWKSNPNVYRTFGQAFEQQFAALVPSLANNLVAGGVKLGDMIGASFTGRPELSDSTKDWLKMQEFTQNFGSVYDDVNGAKMADVMANVTEEIIRMHTLGTIGAGVGAGFEATGVGSKIAQLAAGNPGIVKKATGMALSLVRSSPFVASAWAHDYAELKSLGASNSEAMWNSMITGMSEGILEGFNFDNLWGKVLGQERFATQILDAGKNAFKTAGIVWKARIANMAASGLGEFTEESIGYVLDTYLKMRHSDTWGKGTEWSASDWLSQAGMGFLVGAIGGGMASMDINASRILSEYAMSSEEGLRVVFPDVFVSDGIWGTANETVKASYRTGGATVLSNDAYKALREQAEACVASAQKTLEAARADEADAQEKINNAESEVRKLEDKLAPYMLVKGRKDSLTGKEAEEFGALYAKWNEAKRHAESVRNEVMKDLAEKAGNHERSLQNAESQLKDLQKKIQEHFCGIHLMNEGASPEQAYANLMNAYQNGFKFDGKPAQNVETQAEPAEAKAAEEEAPAAETTKDEASAAAREAAYDRVYTDQEAGKAYGNETKNAKGRKLTRVEFAENERQNFQAKTTAKQGKVTLELAGLEAAEGMSDKEIIAEAKKAMTPDAAKKLDMFMKLSKALGMPMVIRDVVAGTSGYVHDGKLYVTLNGKQALLRVTAHEVTHWMKEHLPSGYDVLRTRLINDVGGQEAFDELVQKKAQEYDLDLSTEKGRLEADDEMCAELCEKMFENKDALEKFVNEAPEAAKTLKARLAKTLVAIKQAIKSLGTSSSKTSGDLIKDQDTIELWYKTLSDAIDAANAEAKGKVQPTIEDVATETETSTEAQPQAPPEADLWSKSYKEWGEADGNSAYAVYLALKKVNPEMAKAYEDGGDGGPQDVLNAVINIANDVRQEQISPMAAATILSNQYNADKSSLGSLFNGAGNATEGVLNAARQIDEERNGAITDLGISAEEVRKQNLRSELEELAKKGTKVKGFKRDAVNAILDRVIVGDSTNYSKADYAQIRGMLAQLIPEIKAMVDGDTSVDLDALNERVQTALNYMLDRYSEPSAELYDLRGIIPGKIALSETAYEELRKNSQMTLREANNRMTRALGKLVNFVYKGSPNYSAASTIDEVWRDIGYEPEGQGTIAEDADALIKYVEERAERSSYDDLYKSQREDMVSAHAGEFLDAVQSMVEGKAANKSEAARYTLDPVDPIEPTSDLWSKTATTAEAKEAFPDLWDVSSEESEDNNPTQRKSTESTYRKIYDILRKEGFSGKILDASSGMGYGTRLGREEYGFDVDDIEPYPGKDYNPMYKDYSTLNEKYDAIISSAVLNVLPQDQRDALVVKMGKMLNPGGKMYITTRGTKGDVDNLAKTGKNIQLGPSEFVETVHGSYQKGFTNPELKAYLEDALGPGFTVEVSNKDNGGKFNNNTSIVVTKNGSDVLYALDEDYMPLAEKYDAGIATDADVEEMRRDVDEAARDNGYTIKAYHGTTEDFTEFNRGTQGQNHDGYLEFGGGFYFTPDAGEAREWVSRGRSGMSGAATPKVMAVYLNPGRILGADDAVPGGADYLRSMWLSAADANFIANRAYRFINYLTEERGFSNTEVQDTLKALGFDAIDATFGQGKSGQYVVFDPEQIKSADPVTYDDDGNVIPPSERFDPNKADIRWTVDDDLDDLVNQYGAIEQGREPRARDVVLPKQVDDNRYVSKLTRSAAESNKTNDNLVSEIESNLGSSVKSLLDKWSYIRKDNASTMKMARNFIAEKGWLGAKDEFHRLVAAENYSLKTEAFGLQLLADAAERGDWVSVKELVPDLRVLATDAGQRTQLFNVLKDLKGAGSAWYLEALVDRLNTFYYDDIQTGKINEAITLSDEVMEQARNAKTQEEVDAAEDAAARELANQLPLKFTDKMTSWRMLSMLGAPVTHGRNVLGNDLMYRMGSVKDIVATGLERIAEKAGLASESDRTTAALSASDKAYWKDFVQKSYSEQRSNLQSGGGKRGIDSRIKQVMRSFDNKFLNTLAQGKNPGEISTKKGLRGLFENIRNNGALGMLEVEDAWGLERQYTKSMTEYMKAQGYELKNGKVGKTDADGTFHEISNEDMNKAIEWATNQAWTATFRGPSQLADMLNKISRMNTASKVIVEGVMPFKKTPINIAKAGFWYSPVGAIVGTAELFTKVKQGKMSAAQAIDHMASGLTGSALLALGAMLAKAGILRAGGEKDKKLEGFLEDTGDQTYSFKFGNASINMSAIAPATIPLFMGVALNEMIDQNGGDLDLSTITDTIAGTLNPFMEMSFMSSINSALKNYNSNGIGGALGNTLLTAAQNYGSQFLPTIGGKVAQFIDPTQRTTKSSATSPVGGNMDYYWRSLVKKVPGLEATLQPDVNIWGQTTTKDSFGDWALDFANKFILPTNVKVTNRDAVDNELIRVVESTGEVNFLPSDGNKYFTVNKQKYTMNAKQYTEYSQERGEASYAAIKEVMNSPAYVNANDTQRADMLEKALKAAQKQVNTNWKYKLGAFD